MSIITKTEKIYWLNGHMIKGVNFHTLSLSFFNLGVMFVWGSVLGKTIKPYVNFYQLI